MKESEKDIVERYVLLSRLCLMLDAHVSNPPSESIAILENNQIKGTVEKSAAALIVFNYVALFIDYIIRIYESEAKLRAAIFVAKLPEEDELKHSTHFKPFFRAVEELRNSRKRLEHPESHIDNIDSDNVLGSVHWTNNRELFVIAFLDVTRTRESTAELDLSIENTGLIYSLNATHLELDEIYSHCQKHCKHVLDTLHNYVEGLVQALEGNLCSFDVSQRTEVLSISVASKNPKLLENLPRGSTVKIALRNPGKK